MGKLKTVIKNGKTYPKRFFYWQIGKTWYNKEEFTLDEAIQAELKKGN